jgi:hypothetical protein
LPGGGLSFNVETLNEPNNPATLKTSSKEKEEEKQLFFLFLCGQVRLTPFQLSPC